MGCNPNKSKDSNQAYKYLNKYSETQFEEAEDFDYEDFEKEYRKTVYSTIEGLGHNELVELFDKFIENRNGAGSPAALDEIINRFGEINTQESADSLLKIYFKHRQYFDAANALSLRCSFKKLDKLSLIALGKIEIEKDTFLKIITDMIVNKKSCI